MSFHRVLPRPPALSNEDLANRWAIGPDSLRSARIMPDETSNTAFLKNGQIPASSSPEPTSRKPSNQVEDLHSFEIEQPAGQSPGLRRHTSIPSPVHKPAPSSIDIWQGESPSQICLCQPDPKVPRPRNGMRNLDAFHTALLRSKAITTANFTSAQRSSSIVNITKPTLYKEIQD